MQPPPRGVATVEAWSFSVGEEIAYETVPRHGSVSENQLLRLWETTCRQQNSRSGDEGVSPPVAHDPRREVGDSCQNGGEGVLRKSLGELQRGHGETAENGAVFRGVQSDTDLMDERSTFRRRRNGHWSS